MKKSEKKRDKKNHPRFKPIKHHVKHHYRKYKESPKGIKILVLYSTVLAVLYFVFGILFPTAIVFGHELNGPVAQFMNLLSFAFMVIILYGFVHRRSWVWELSLLWYIISLISSFIAIIVMSSNILSLLSDSIILASLAIFLINGVTIWYLYTRKKYFKTKYPHFHDNYDRVYIHIMTIFFVILLLTATLVVTSFYQNTTKTIDNTINNLRGRTLEEALFFCSNQKQPDRDLCFLTIAAVHPNLVEPEVCNLIFSNFYRLTCFEALS